MQLHCLGVVSDARVRSTNSHKTNNDRDSECIQSINNIVLIKPSKRKKKKKNDNTRQDTQYQNIYIGN